MTALKRIALALGLLAVMSTSSAKFDYSPCSYSEGEEHMLSCSFKKSADILEAFRRNRNNREIQVLYLTYSDDMSDDVLGEILDIVASSANQELFHLELKNLTRVTKIPEAIQHLPKLQDLYIGWMDGIEILPSGYIISNNISSLYLNFLTNLRVIEAGAFQGDFKKAKISILNNGLTKLDEAVFKPLLSDSSTTLDIRGNSIPCENCDLAWIARDNRQLLDQITGGCLDANGTEVQLQQFNFTILSDCSGVARSESTRIALILVFVVYILNY